MVIDVYERKNTHYIADSIQAINIEVRDNKSTENATRIAREEGYYILRQIQTFVERHLSAAQLAQVEYATWDDLVDSRYKEKVEHTYLFFENHANFRHAIMAIVRNHVSKESRLFNEKQLKKLALYILAELPELLNRVTINGTIYDAYTYPFDTELTRFVEQIQKGKIFPDLRSVILDTQPKVFLEVR